MSNPTMSENEMRIWNGYHTVNTLMRMVTRKVMLLQRLNNIAIGELSDCIRDGIVGAYGEGASGHKCWCEIALALLKKYNIAAYDEARFELRELGFTRTGK